MWAHALTAWGTKRAAAAAYRWILASFSQREVDQALSNSASGLFSSLRVTSAPRRVGRGKRQGPASARGPAERPRRAARGRRSKSGDGGEGCPGGGNREPLTRLEQRWREAPRKKVAAFKVDLFACQMGSL